MYSTWVHLSNRSSHTATMSLVLFGASQTMTGLCRSSPWRCDHFRSLLTRSAGALLMTIRCTRPGLECCRKSRPAHTYPFRRRVTKCLTSSPIENMPPAFDRNSLESRREDTTTVPSSRNCLDLVQKPAGEHTAKSKESHSHKGWQWGDQSRDSRERVIAGPSWPRNVLAMSSAYILTRCHDGPSQIDPGQEKP